MAKMILANKGTMPVANSGLKLSKTIPLDKIEKHPKFESLYKIEEALLKRIEENMKENGFDSSQPVHIWIVTDENGEEHFYLIDGYTRFSAAQEIGITYIPYIDHKFETIDEALRYAIHLQVDRRNLSNSELLKNVEALMGSEYIQNLPNKAEAIAEELNIGKRTVERTISVLKNSSPEEIEEIKKDNVTINATYKKNSQKKNSKKKNETDSDDESDSLTDNSGTPASLNFNHSDGHEHASYQPTVLPKEIDDERTAERKEAYELGKKDGYDDGRNQGFSEAFYKCLMFCISEMLRGKTPAEIYNDERISDLSPTEIIKFELPDDAEDLVARL